MRVLIVSRTGVRTSDAPLLLCAALERRRIAADLLPVDAGLPMAAEIGLAVGGEHDRVYRRMINRRLRQAARRRPPDLVVVYGSCWGLEPDTIDELRRRAEVVLWEVNGRFDDASGRSCVDHFDHVFALDSHVAWQLQAGGIRRVHHLPACADPDEHAPAELTPDERAELSCDVCFVGTAHPARIELLGELAGLALRVHGPGWEGVDPSMRAMVRTSVSDEPIHGLRKAKLYGAARLTLNVRGPHMVWGENFRVFEVAACGGASVSAPSPDLLRCLTAGEEVAVFDGPDECRRLVHHLLDHPDELAAMREAGRRRVLAEHTYDHRAAEILETIGAA